MSEFRPNMKRSGRSSARAELTLDRARELRGAMSVPEVKLWTRLRGRRLRGLRFRRQHPMPPYIIDFYCNEARLAVELDGRSHELRKEEDEARDAWLNRRGVEVLRISVSAFERDIGAALTRIADAAERRIKALSSANLEQTFASGSGGSVEGVATEPPPPAAPAPPPVGEEGR